MTKSYKDLDIYIASYKLPMYLIYKKPNTKY